MLPEVAFFKVAKSYFFTFNFGVFGQYNLVALKFVTISYANEMYSDCIGLPISYHMMIGRMLIVVNWHVIAGPFAFWEFTN